MPCESAYLEAAYGEVESKKLCILICFVFKKINWKIPQWIVAGAEAYYGNQRRLNELEDLLAQTLKNIYPDQLNEIVYNAHDPNSRKLADWWEDLKSKEAEINQPKKMEVDSKRFINDILLKLREDEVEIINKYIDWDKVNKDYKDKEN